MNGVIEDLERWYQNQCDGDWEHEFGLSIENIDNPGWKVSIPLERTACEKKSFNEVNIERSEADWLHCKKQDGKFVAWGGVSNLSEILELFLSWEQSS